MNICVFCGSNPAIGEPYVTAAREVGQAIGQGGHTLVFGGFEMGLMGEVARAAKAAGARVIGVVPKTLVGAPHRVIFDADELIQTVDLAQRKRVMEDAADGFISLAGAYGTLDELYEVLAMRKAAQGSPAPVALVNTDGFYDPLAAMHAVMLERGFMSQDDFDYARFVPDGAAAVRALERA
ncbi:LOG family protein yvdD [Slackia heliotrinireducens]|jgi:uncharacterized protein (TIGR00730 family)|uniref:Cytokinin riboside 5'-monophosphate phosphoribohydrolase n=1 Tax=Slackia heliotrinireducens (strain ATCC 29202 / DSM 20476 / NCTC 11029 / RHS 1) TaxID=471855 RepID=C7N1K7_SLAHD|nr:TIGR00730 family Rossman fold protein [Slackia heliotrinireducens]ACV21299.1 conserved hypothetical protein, DprA/Smf-related, family 2 [Slackia heliotrinireducens DSM 20476]VEG98734.1 LOG family protein yvdD [Slackia heliotrinireducens]